MTLHSQIYKIIKSPLSNFHNGVFYFFCPAQVGHFIGKEEHRGVELPCISWLGKCLCVELFHGVNIFSSLSLVFQYTAPPATVKPAVVDAKKTIPS